MAYQGARGCRNQPNDKNCKEKGLILKGSQTMAWNSLKSFCIGVPERIMRRGVLSASNILDVLLLADFRRWPYESRLGSAFRSRQAVHHGDSPSSQMMRPIGGLFTFGYTCSAVDRVRTDLQYASSSLEMFNINKSSATSSKSCSHYSS